jgi:hypothetical protein
MKKTLFIACAFVFSVACSSLLKDDPEKNVRAFLTSFQSDLTRVDDGVFDKFRVKQSRDAIESVINILRNKDPFILCDASFPHASVVFEGDIVRVDVPVTFNVKALQSDETEPFVLQLWLSSNEKTYVITEINGEGLYQSFNKIKNATQWQAEEKLALQSRLWIYEKAKALQQTFDSVIWYTTYEQTNFFYVVQGEWTNYFLSHKTRGEKNKDVKMGLVDDQGQIVIPVDYDLIGSIAFDNADLVEVFKNSKIGIFNVTTRQQIVEPVYDLIIPYGRNKVWAIVKRDTTYGWLDEEFTYQSGFPSNAAEEWMKGFDFLKKEIQLKAGNQNFCEIPSPNEAGNGIIIPPRYLSFYGIFDEIEGSISTTPIPINGWYEYKETKGTFLESITDNVRAVVTTIRDRYLEGREEFYEANKILFISENMDTLAASTISGSTISMKMVDSTLLEVRTPEDLWFGEYEASVEYNLDHHSYFALTENGKIEKRETKRLYPQTQFVKLDSSYLIGKFNVYNPETDQRIQTTFLSKETIIYMRDEILGYYGYISLNHRRNEQLRNNSEFELSYSDISQFQDKMSEIDKHNLAFLNKILELMEKSDPTV